MGKKLFHRSTGRSALVAIDDDRVDRPVPPHAQVSVYIGVHTYSLPHGGGKARLGACQIDKRLDKRRAMPIIGAAEAVQIMTIYTTRGLGKIRRRQRRAPSRA